VNAAQLSWEIRSAARLLNSHLAGTLTLGVDFSAAAVTSVPIEAPGAELATEREDLTTTRRIALRINVLARLIRNQFDREVSALNITRSQWSMIAVVAGRPGATQRVIADILEMSEASAGRLIDRLCAEGILQRQEKVDDRRARAIYLTKEAEPLLAKLGQIGRESERRVFKGMTAEELESLLSALDKIHANIA
jgi:MarR family transcriptional regulator for hemolysin